MCPPVLTAVAGIASGIGGLMQTGAQKAQYQAQSAAAKREAAIQDQIGFVDASKVATNVNREIDKSIAGNAANGINVSGSALEGIKDIAREGDLDVQTIRWNAGQRKDKLLFESKVADMNAKAASRAAPFAFLSPVLDSAVKIGGMYAKAA
jgi:hypothetical protein